MACVIEINEPESTFLNQLQSKSQMGKFGFGCLSTQCLSLQTMWTRLAVNRDNDEL